MSGNIRERNERSAATRSRVNQNDAGDKKMAAPESRQSIWRNSPSGSHGANAWSVRQPDDTGTRYSGRMQQNDTQLSTRSSFLGNIKPI